MTKPTLTYQVASPDKWLRTVSEPLGGKIDGNIARFDNDRLKGTVKYDQLEPGLYFTKIDIVLLQSVLMERKGVPENDYFILNLYRSDLQQTIAEETRRLGYNSPYGLFFSSTHTSAIIELPINKPISIHNITISKGWLEDNIFCDLEDSHFLRNAVANNKALLFYESNDIDYQRMINGITADSTLLPSLRSLIIKGKVIELLSTFFSRIIKREEAEVSVRLHPGDKEAISKVRLIVLRNLSERSPSLDSLAKESAMSVSKLKRLFRQVYGESIYNYALKARIQKAYDLLTSGKYNVSDVAFRVGYTNLGQFSKIFKRETGSLPSDLL